MHANSLLKLIAVTATENSRCEN